MSRPYDSHREWHRYLMRRWWLLGGLLLTLGALAAVQYYWIREVTRAERERIVASLTSALTGLKSEFDLEITRPFGLFAAGTAGHEDYLQRYTQWQRLSPYPRLLLGVYIVESEGAESSLRSIDRDEPMPPATWRDDVARFAQSWATQLLLPSKRADTVGGRTGYGRSMQQTAKTGEITIAGNPAFALALPPDAGPPANRNIAAARIDQSAFPLLLSLPEGESPETALTAARPALAVFDASYAASTLLPELMGHHLPGGAASDYEFRVIDNQGAVPGRVIFSTAKWSRSDTFRQPDAQIDLFAPRLECLTRHLAPDTSASAGAPSRTRELWPIADLLTRRAATCEDNSSASRPLEPPGRWTLQINYRPQAGHDGIATFERRSFLFSCGVLLVLGLGVLTLIVLAERASALAQTRTELLLGVSHELRTPLTIIRVAAGNLRKGMPLDHEAAREYGETISAEARRLSAMIEDMLVFARMQSGRLVSDTTVVAAEQVVRNALAASELALRQAGLAVEVEITPHLPLLQVESRLIEKCVENLLQNVIRYASAGGWMAIRASLVERPEGWRVSIRVEDRGPGISPTDLPHVFEPFYRGRNRARAGEGGLGLGLTFVSRIVAAHGGSVEASASSAGGAVFSLFLPGHRP
jgi:signal transduction histidine kinase